MRDRQAPPAMKPPLAASLAKLRIPPALPPCGPPPPHRLWSAIVMAGKGLSSNEGISWANVLADPG